MLPQKDLEDYTRMRLGKLFGVYLTLVQQPALHPQDQGELEKVVYALMNRPLPEKVEFYNTLDDPGHMDLYWHNFILLK